MPSSVNRFSRKSFRSPNLLVILLPHPKCVLFLDIRHSILCAGRASLKLRQVRFNFSTQFSLCTMQFDRSIEAGHFRLQIADCKFWTSWVAPHLPSAARTKVWWRRSRHPPQNLRFELEIPQSARFSGWICILVAIAPPWLMIPLVVSIPSRNSRVDRRFVLRVISARLRAER